MFTIPDKGEGANDIQSILFQEYLEKILAAGISGKNCVLNGCAVTQGADPNDMNLSVLNGSVISNGTLLAIAGSATVAIGAADATNPRIDLIVIPSGSAVITVRAGTPAAAPKPPAMSNNDTALAAVYVPANDTGIGDAQITDMRVMREQGPIVIKKVTTPVVFNNTAAQQTYFTVTLPQDLFAAGRQLRVRCGGTMLLNSGTPTVRLVITFGGTTMFSDISGAATADADRNSWDLDVTLTAQGVSDQSLNGIVVMGIIAAKTAPTTGIGDSWSTAENAGSINGSSAVNHTAGNQDFDVRFTMSVANAANEIAMEYAVAELL